MSGVEQAAIVAAVKVGAACAGGALLAGLCIYGLYKLFSKEKPHGHSNKGRNIALVTTLDDLKAEIPLKAPPSNKPTRRDDPKKDEAEKEKKQKQLEEELEERIRKLEEEVELRKQADDRRRQLEEELQRRQQIEYQNRLNNLLDGNESVAETDATSVSSCTETGSEGSVLRWSRMTEEERRAQMCLACDVKAVRTISKCGHPLFCLTCMDDFLPHMGVGKNIKGCPRCLKPFDKETVSLRIVTA